MKSHVLGIIEHMAFSSLPPDILSKTIQQLEDNDWGEPTFSSHLVTECYRLRQVPLQDFTAGDLRIMIGQTNNLEYLVPLALDLLEADPFVEGDFYEGDLLWYTNRIPSKFWNAHPGLNQRWQAIIDSVGGPFDAV